MTDPVARLHIVLREPKPVSVNRMYGTGKQGQKFLTPEGKHFKDALTQATMRKTLEGRVLWPEVVDLVYKQRYYAVIRINLYLSSLYNGAWEFGGGKTASGERRSPYKKVDGSNYTKLIEDAVATGTGIDDSCNLGSTTWKYEDKKDPRVEVFYDVYRDDR